MDKKMFHYRRYIGLLWLFPVVVIGVYFLMLDKEPVAIHEHYLSFYTHSSLFLLGYGMFMGLFVFYRKQQFYRNAKQRIALRYRKIEIKSNRDKNETLLLDYLNAQYLQQELTLTEVQKGTGISERNISAILKQRTDQNYKQYLNTLRIAEAKRLLQETDLSIFEIGFRVGYGNTSHFNKIFKAMEACSPGDYRKKIFVLEDMLS